MSRALITLSLCEAFCDALSTASLLETVSVVVTFDLAFSFGFTVEASLLDLHDFCDFVTSVTSLLRSGLSRNCL